MTGSRLPAVLIAVGMLTACTETTNGQTQGSGDRQGANQMAETPPIPETRADLAIRAINLRRLLDGLALAQFGASQPSPAGLHSCQVRLVRADNGDHDYLTLSIGAAFGPSD